jgi:hypothetical protein
MLSAVLICTGSSGDEVDVVSRTTVDPPTLSNDSRNGVGIPRIGSPNASVLSFWRISCRAKFASFLCFACAKAYGSLCFLLWAIVATLAFEVMGRGPFEAVVGRTHTGFLISIVIFVNEIGQRTIGEAYTRRDRYPRRHRVGFDKSAFNSPSPGQASKLSRSMDIYPMETSILRPCE